MNKISAVAAAALMIGSTAAYAGEPSDSASTNQQPSFSVVGNPIVANVGSHREAQFDTSVAVPFVVGAILPTTGSNGLVQTANSLPSAPEIKGAWAYPSNYAAATGQSVPAAGFASRTVPGNAS